ncbi:MAG: glycosyltransferase family 2 protein [Candidatus Woesearchaeota archaeon]
MQNSTVLYNIKVSVIVPVYNAAPFVRQAVESAVDLPEVGEIILVEDNSPDNSLEICKELEAAFSKVKLYRHPNKENRGAGASRNLGIKNASCNYIAFLDADDYYLPNRFKAAKSIFKQNPEADGVYDASQLEGNYQQNNNKYRSVKKNVAPENLFYHLLKGDVGYFHTNSITLKKHVFNEHLFDKKLRLHQDSELWFRLAYHFKLYPGNLNEPTSIVRRHENNRITSRNIESRSLYINTMFNYYANKQDLSSKNKTMLNRLFFINYYKKIDNRFLRAGFKRMYMFINYIIGPILFKINKNKLHQFS